jgi:holliday junction DNA helicase RuvA
MISRVTGRLVAKEIDRAEVMTDGGVAYDIAIPLPVFETLAAVGDQITLHTHLVIREDAWQLYGFASPFERQVFRAVLGAKGVGPALALSLLSSLSVDRLIQAIRDRDIGTLQTVPRVGRKKAEQLVLDLADKLDELFAAAARERGVISGIGSRPPTPGAEDAVLGLLRLGYGRADAERAVRGVLESGTGSGSVSDLIRGALATIAGR